jgi:hypothetical protein
MKEFPLDPRAACAGLRSVVFVVHLFIADGVLPGTIPASTPAERE